MSEAIASMLSLSPRFTKETLLRGKPATVHCLDCSGQTYVIQGGLISMLSLEEEWYEDLADPQAVIRTLQTSKTPPADILTFWQRIPDVDAKYPYLTEWEEVAVLHIRSYEDWLKRQVRPQVRNKIRKAEKAGVVVKEVPYDDDFVKGMTAIFNESPVRQGRPFWHYGKTFETVKTQFSRYLFRERMIGAYFAGEMIGFVMLANAGRFAIPGQIVASLKHRDKGASNALMAKAVEVCAAQNIDRLVYMYWGDDSLADFKRYCGFEPVRVPRYWVPLTRRGRLALALGMHRGWKALVPAGLKTRFKDLRRRWYERHAE